MRGTRLSLLLLCALSAAAVTAEIRFSDDTGSARLIFKHESSPTSSKYLLETMGGGVALLDYNGDSLLDIFFTNGAKLTPDMSEQDCCKKLEPRFWNRLFRQNPDRTFTDVSELAGVTGATQGGYSFGAAAGDFDGDGDADLYVTAYGGNTLYRNDGNGKFADATKTAGVAGSGWSSSAGWFDYDNDGDLDLFVGRYLTWTLADRLYCGERKPGYRAYCHPDNYKGASNLLFRNDGDGKFTDVSEAAGFGNLSGKALGVAFADYDGDGWTDIYVANDSVQSFLFRNKRDGTFTEEALLAGVGFNEDGKTFAGMGVDFADYDNDGKPDIVVTNLSSETYALYRNNGDGTFLYATVLSGLAEATRAFSGWGTRLIDFDLDGWKDLFVAQGHVLDTIELTNPPLKHQQPPLIAKNISGKFSDAGRTAGPAFSRPWAGRGAAFGDIDNDGDIDVVVANCGQPAYLLRNASPPSAWVGFNLIGKASARDATGAVIKLVTASGLTQWGTVSAAGSYLSSNDRRVVFGLGAGGKIKSVEIRWPGGRVQTVAGAVPGKYHEIIESK